MELPTIVSQPEWERANEAQVSKEKRATRERDALAAERRRQPMREISPDYEFDGPGGHARLIDLFEGRSQLILYHFMFRPGGEPCEGCSMFADQIGHVAHLHARDTTFALASPASQREIDDHKRRTGWQFPWYTTLGEAFQAERNLDGGFRLDVYLRDSDRVFLTYSTTGRGVEALGSVWTLLDLTPFGRQEEWEDTPSGRPQTPPYQWWRLHDRYDG